MADLTMVLFSSSNGIPTARIPIRQARGCVPSL
jgi:hypothetical protein